MKRFVIYIFIIVMSLSFCSCNKVNNFTLYKVEGEAMLPNFKSGEHFILNTRAESYDYGDLIIYVHISKTNFSEERFNYFWRIAALPGDIINVNYDQFSIKGKSVDYRKTGEGVLEYEGYLYDEYEEILPNGKKHLILCCHPLSEESYLIETLTVPIDRFYSLCDLRSKSFDSRLLGTIPLKNIQGKVVKEIKKKNFFIARWEFYKYAFWGYKKEHEK